MKISVPVTELLKSIPAVFGIHLDERPKYKTIEKGDLEIRAYSPMKILSRIEKGRHEWAINKAFTRLAAFIFGNNISMTIPVFQKKNSKGVILSFFIPDHVDLPEVEKELYVEEIPERTIAVFSYTGLNNPLAMDRAKRKLKNLLRNRGDLEALGEVFWAQYDAPSTIPLLRKNEAMVEVKKLILS